MKSRRINSDIFFSVFWALSTLLFSSCIDNEDGGSQSIKKEKISGFVQKGPFVRGTSILMSELNSDLAQTGKVFTSQIINDQGLFEITNIELNSSFVEFSSSGFYFNEVTGEISSAPITLTSISDLSNKSSINVNVLTHLEKKRVENLIKGGKSFSESKKEAKKEVLSIFSIVLDSNSDFEDYDISKNTEEGGILLAISIILQGNRSVGQLTELLSKIQSDIASDGKLDDLSLLNSLRVSTFGLDLASIRTKIESRNKELNITSPVPDFEKHVVKFLDIKDLKITIEGSGTVREEIVSNPSGREYLSGTTVKLIPVPSEGWIFESWGGDLSGNENPKILIIDVPKNISAKFKRRDYALNITIEGEGTVNEEIISNPSGREYPFQTVVKLTPIPKEGWLFESWGGDLSGNESSKTISIDKEKSVIVKFRNPVFRLAENGVTCVCENVKPGEKGFINGVEFEAVDNDLLRKRRDEGADITKLCISLVTDLSRLFEERDFNQAIGNWDVSNVTNMNKLFFFSRFNRSISFWNTENVNNMSRMFEGSPFNQPIGSWKVGKVENMSGMFKSSPFNQPIGNWNVSKVTDMSQIFQYSGFNQPIGDWNVSSLKNMSEMFSSSFNHPLENWNVSNVTDMSYTFSGSDFNQPIEKWDVSNVTTMRGMFVGSKFNQPIGKWNVSKVTSMMIMFSLSQFNQPINEWDVSNVKDMSWMFAQSSVFNQDLSKWCVRNIPSRPSQFDTETPQWTLPKPVWGTCPN